jgi:hypothetical protein
MIGIIMNERATAPARGRSFRYSYDNYAKSCYAHHYGRKFRKYIVNGSHSRGILVAAKFSQVKA